MRIFSSVFLAKPASCCTRPSSQAAFNDSAESMPSSAYNFAIFFPPSPGIFNKGGSPTGTSCCNCFNSDDSPVSSNSVITEAVPLPIPFKAVTSSISSILRGSFSSAAPALR